MNLRKVVASAVAATLTFGGLTAMTVTSQVASAAGAVNPIISDGSYYTTDPAPFIGADGKLYILTGRDEAGPTTNDFIMNEWEVLETSDVAAGSWTLHPAVAKSKDVFAWATTGRAYAGQIVPAPDGKYYLYASVQQTSTASADRFAIGVGVSNSPTGPFTDALGAPLMSQSIGANTIQNIDPTVLIDDDSRVYMYWGTFGQARMVELNTDMKTLKGAISTVSGLTGFFEAPWIMKRNGTYYLAYAGNNAGPTSQCTPANYHACIAYASAPAPTGPWTYRGTVLDPVSSTTSHPGFIQYQGQWYITYHTADAVGGNHFRRSVAIDKLEWDDTQTPARMKKVVTTPAKTANLTPRPNIAQRATVSVSNTPVPTQYWVKALNDEIIRANPLPPDMWATYAATRPETQWVQYDWNRPVRIAGSEIKFWRDVAPGTGNGVSNPASWVIQYWDAETNGWKDVPNPSGYGTSNTAPVITTFDPVTTTRVRATIKGSPGTAGFSAVAVEEWKINAAQPTSIDPVTISTPKNEMPELPETVIAHYAGGVDLPTAVYWAPIDSADLAAAGTFNVQGSVLGYGAGYVQAAVTVVAPADLRTNVALTATPTASFTSAWEHVTGLNDNVEPTSSGPLDPTLGHTWGTWPENAPQWVQYDWATPVDVSESDLYFIHDIDDTGQGLAEPASYNIQYWDAATEAWKPVVNPSAFGTEINKYNKVTFDPVKTTKLRVNLTSVGTEPGASAFGIHEWKVIGEPSDVTAPVVELTKNSPDGANSWYTTNVLVRATATDDRDIRTNIETKIDAGEWVSVPNSRFVEVTVNTDGVNSVQARATDAAGNASAPVSASIKIDKVAPTVTGSSVTATRTVTVTGADATSGIASVQYSVGNQTSWQAYTAPVVISDSSAVTVYYRATDNAGLVSAVGSLKLPPTVLTGNVATYGTPTASYTASWNLVTAVNDDAVSFSGGAQTTLWGTWAGNTSPTEWLQYNWDFPVTVDKSEINFWTDTTTAGSGVAVPASWKIQYWDGANWADLVSPSGFGVVRGAVNTTTFAPVTTTRLRATFNGLPNAGGTAWSAIGVSEWKVFAASATTPDTTAPVVTASAPTAPASGWFTAGPILVTASATDAVDPSPKIEFSVNGTSWDLGTASGANRVFSVSADGTTSVQVRASDAAGNVSTATSVPVKIDSMAPMTAAVVAGDGPVSVTLTSSDPGTGSGVAGIKYRIGTSGPWLDYSAAFSVVKTPGAQTVQFQATDVAGNVEGVKSVQIPGSKTTVESTTALSVAVPEVPAGQPVVAVVTVSSAGAVGADQVTISEGDTVVGSGTLSGGSATISIVGLAVGTHSLKATFAGNALVDPSTSAAVSVKVSFSDVASGSQFAEDIEWLVEAGITTGFADGSFRAGLPIDRQSMAAFLFRAANPGMADPTCGTTSPFTDVPVGSRFCGVIKWLSTSGITAGTGDGKFSPAKVVDRQAMAAFLYRMETGMTALPSCTVKPYPDVALTNQFCGAIAWLKSTEITTGYADGGFHPAGAVARGAMAAFLHRWVELD